MTVFVNKNIYSHPGMQNVPPSQNSLIPNSFLLTRNNGADYFIGMKTRVAKLDFSSPKITYFWDRPMKITGTQSNSLNGK